MQIAGQVRLRFCPTCKALCANLTLEHTDHRVIGGLCREAVDGAKYKSNPGRKLVKGCRTIVKGTDIQWYYVHYTGT